MPTDEWSIDTSGEFSTDLFGLYRAYADVDSAVQLKREIGSTLWTDEFTGSAAQVERWQATTGGPFILQANADQRLWVLSTRNDVPRIDIENSAQAWGVQRYYSLRGNR